MAFMALPHSSAPTIQPQRTKSRENQALSLLKSTENRTFSLLRSIENHTFSLLQSCTTLDQLYQLHAHILKNGIHHSNFVITKFLSLSFELGCSELARQVFDDVPKSNTFCYNAMIKGLVQTNSHHEAIWVFMKMLNNGVPPNNYTFPFILKACFHLHAIEEGRAIHSLVFRSGFPSDVYVQTALIHFYVSCGLMDNACQVFDNMSQRDVVSWNIMLCGHVKHGDMFHAHKIFDEMPQRSLASWTAIIGGYVQNGNSFEALSLFQSMQLDGMIPDNMMLVTMLSACASLRSLEMGKWVHDYMDKNGFVIDVFAGTALIDMYAKCGSIEDARTVFNVIPERSVSCYNAMISGLAIHGLGNEAVRVFSEMESKGIEVDDITLIAILSACSHSGMVEEGCRHFNSMKEVHGIEPKMEHYGCMVDLLGRAGLFNEAVKLVKSMPFKADSVVLGTLASACQLHGNVELGENVMMELSDLDPLNGGVFVLKSNIYAAGGRWEEAARVRKLMKQRGIQKKPGCSSIEVNNALHEFTAGDDSHPRSEEIYAKLAELYKQIKSLEELQHFALDGC
ncbi:hypothetical protein AMTRI_Chr06g200250 [Amborella trichopoda]